MKKQAIHTTGRTATRMTEADRTKLQQKLAPFVPSSSWLNSPPAGLEVELGIGNGLAMLERAKNQPGKAFLGCEVYLNGLRTLLHHLAQAEESAKNIKLSSQDARELLATLGNGTVARVIVAFPDPWPKSGHHKRRLVQPEVVAEVARVLQPGGEFWVVTDWPSYAYHSIAVMFASKNLKLNQTEPLAADCKPSARLENPLGPQHLAMAPAWWQTTKYQQKANLAGRNTWYIKAIKVA